jgi:hypothetical protein
MTTRRRKKRRPEEIVAKLRDAEAMLNAGKDLAAVLQALEVSRLVLSLPTTTKTGPAASGACQERVTARATMQTFRISCR